jgi:hypothetical protein
MLVTRSKPETFLSVACIVDLELLRVTRYYWPQATRAAWRVCLRRASGAELQSRLPSALLPPPPPPFSAQLLALGLWTASHVSADLGAALDDEL